MAHEYFEFKLLGILLKNKINPATPIEEWKFKKGGYINDEVQLVQISPGGDLGEFIIRADQLPPKPVSLDEIGRALSEFLKKDKTLYDMEKHRQEQIKKNRKTREN